ncbi:MAG: hypothetical protein ACRDF5_11305 [bacterium]
MSDRQIDAAANTLQAMISALGRDDIGVGEVSQREGVIYFTLTKGHFTHSAQIPADLLTDRQRALIQLNGIVRTISKEIESEHIEAATKTQAAE